MKYYSTKNRNIFVSFHDAVMNGLADDGGLYMPDEFPDLAEVVNNIEKYEFSEIGYEIVKNFVEHEITSDKLHAIVNEAINFPAEVIMFNDTFSVLELFHGPTLAFKDFGARFMAGVMEHFTTADNDELNILVATSGDTGSAVANGFYNREGINVFILYPSGKVSEIQEKQLTTLGGNVTALEIEGTFDDCQRLVKTAFVDSEIKIKKKLSSANSINIARLLPQSFYYFEAFKKVKQYADRIIFSVPSGNLGNLTAGLFAKRMGLPVYKFVAATNLNDVFTQFLHSGDFNPRPSIKTYSNAMDVGNPSNLARIRELYDDDLSIMNDVIFSSSFSDKQTLEGISEVYEKYNYIIDPHGSVGYLSLKEYFRKVNKNDLHGLVLETAHPSKFKDIVEEQLGIKIELPERLKQSLNKEKKSVKISSEYSEFKDYFLSA